MTATAAFLDLAAADVGDVLRLVLPLALVVVVIVVVLRSEFVRRLRALRSAQRRVGLARVSEILPTQPSPQVGRTELARRAGVLALVLVATVVVVTLAFAGIAAYVVGAVVIVVVLAIGTPLTLIPPRSRRRSFRSHS